MPPQLGRAPSPGPVSDAGVAFSPPAVSSMTPSLRVRDLPDGTREITNAEDRPPLPALSRSPMTIQAPQLARGVQPPPIQNLGPLPRLDLQNAPPGQSVFEALGKLSDDMRAYQGRAIANRQAQRNFNNEITANSDALGFRRQAETERHNRANEAVDSRLADIRREFGAGAETAMMKNVQFMTKNNIAKDPTEAFNLLRTTMGKSDDDAILSLTGQLMRGTGYFGRKGYERALADATKMVQTVRQSQAARPGAARPGTGTYTLRGKTFSDADIESTAARYGITPDEVKQRLGVQ